MLQASLRSFGSMRLIKGAVLLLFTAFFGGAYLTGTGAFGRGRVVAGTAPAAPTNVKASDNDYSMKVGINWDTIRGATVYRIFRNTVNDTSTATDIGATQANYFFDTGAAVAQLYFYWVRAENGSGSSQLSSPDQGTRGQGGMLSGPFSPLEPPIQPAENPVTAAKAYLGKALFWDEQLSSTRTVACGTCHRPGSGGSDPRTVTDHERSRNPGPDNLFGTGDDIFGSPGVPQNYADGTYGVNPLFGMREQVTGRKSPSYLNVGLASQGLFWDGRASNQFRDPLTNNVLITSWGSLESQATGPPLSSAEMGHMNRNWTEAAAQIQASHPLALATNVPTALSTWIDGRNYPQLFEEAFGTPDVTPARIAMAIATHERTLFSDRSPFDRYLMELEPLAADEARGLDVFVAQHCSGCHGGPAMTEHNFHNIGVRPRTDDPGRFAVTGEPGDRGRFKTPGLRNVELRGAYMHTGGLATLTDVVEFYNRGGDFDAPNIDRDVIRPLNLTAEEKSDLLAFLKRPLTDPRVASELPPFDRPTLYTETNRVPVVSGRGRPGSKFKVPEMIAIEPPIVGNPSFTVAVAGGRGGSQATLVIGSSDPGIGTTIPAGGSFAYHTITLSDYGAFNGYGSVSIAIPDNLSLVGQTYYGRWYVKDLRAVGGFSVSKLVTFTLF